MYIFVFVKSDVLLLRQESAATPRPLFPFFFVLCVHEMRKFAPDAKENKTCVTAKAEDRAK